MSTALTPSRTRELAVLAILIVLIAVPRLLALDADPPADMSLHYVTDEGWWAHNARDHALFGQWIMDEHNEALIWAPLYTGVLRIVYALLGVGIEPTRLLAAVAGLATCVVVYGFVRASHGWIVAALATALLGTDYLWFSYNRTGFVESFQTPFIAAACLATVAATRRPGWAFVAGVCMVLALLAKVSAVVAGVVVVAYWVVTFLIRRGARDGRGFAWSHPLLFAAGVVVTTGLALVLIRPDPSLLAPKTAQRVEMTTSHDPILSLMTVGLFSDDEHVARVSGLVTGAPLLLLGAFLLAVRRLAFSRARLPALEIMCWCWVSTSIVVIGLLRYWQPDRRFLLVLPPLAILLAMELGGATAQAETSDPPTRFRRLATALFIAIAVGFVGRPYPANRLHALLGDPSLGAGGGLGLSGSVALVWAAFVVVVTPIAYVLLGRVSAWSRHTVPVWVVLVLYGGLNLGRAGTYLAAPTYALRDASAQLADIARTLPRERRVAVGDVADTLGMGTDLFTFVIRRWPYKNMYMNLDGWERFRPAIALADQAERAGLEARADLTHVADLLLAPNRHGKPRRRIGVYVERQ